MIRRISILSYIVVFTLFLNCKKETTDTKLAYNKKANEVIQQVILEEHCPCVLEIPKESLIKMYISDNPIYDIRTKAIKQLNLRNGTELDSLEKLSMNFILDTSFFKQRNFKVINRNSLREKMDNLILSKTCPNGFLSISKPIFDKNYTTALIYSTIEPTCIGSYPEIYKYEKGKWKREVK
jgi:hypothetical protein